MANKHLQAKIKKGIPVCPECETHSNNIYDYGVTDKGKAKFQFKFQCTKCSDKKQKVFVKYYTDGDFKVIQSRKKETEEDDQES